LYMVKIPPQLLSTTKTIVQLGVYQNGKRITSNNVKFIGPLKKQL